MSQFLPITPVRASSSAPSGDETLVEKHNKSKHTVMTPTDSPSEVSDPPTIDRFTRTVLDEAFGPGFSKQGFTKTGTKSGLVEASSPAVKEEWVRVKDNDQIDRRCTAVKQGLVQVDKSGDVIKSESILCKTQLKFTPSGKVSKSSPAVQDGLVELTSDGGVDKDSTAVKKGWLKVDKDGYVDEAESALCQKLFLKETNGSHIHGFEVADQITKLAGLTYTKEEAQRMVLAINEDRNVYMKTRGGNMTGSITAPEGSGDLSLDRELVAALESANKGETVSLDKLVADRAVRVVKKILTRDFPVEFQESARKLFNQLTDDNGHKIVRSNAKISTPDGADKYHVQVKKSEAKAAAAAVSKNLNGAFTDAAASSSPSSTSPSANVINTATAQDDMAEQKAQRKRQEESQYRQEADRARQAKEQQRQLEVQREQAAERQREAREKEERQEREAAVQRQRETREREERQQREAAAQRQREREREAEQRRVEQQRAEAARQQRAQEEAAAERRRQSERVAEQQRQQELQRQQEQQRLYEQQQRAARERATQYYSSQPTYYSSYSSYSSSPSSIYSGSFSGGYHVSRGSANGSALFTGPRGGTYYVNSSGNRSYV